MDYSAEVRRRFAATMAGADRAGGGPPEYAGEAEDRTLAVWARARIRVVDGRIAAAAFDVYGCPDTLAAAAYAEEQLRGTGLHAFHGLEVRGLAGTLGIPTEKLGKLLRLEDAVLAAVERARQQEDQEDQEDQEGNNDDITD